MAGAISVFGAPHPVEPAEPVSLAGQTPSMAAVARTDSSPSASTTSIWSGLLARCGESASLADQLSPSQAWAAGESMAGTLAFALCRPSSCEGRSGVANTDGISGNAEIAFPRQAGGSPLRFNTSALASKWARMRPPNRRGWCTCADSNSVPCRAVELCTGRVREKSPSCGMHSCRHTSQEACSRTSKVSPLCA